jgi:nitrous oxidase accessory protein NosD
MQHSKAFYLIVTGMLTLSLLTSIEVQGKELRVPEQYPTISAAVEAASAAGDSILVTNQGTYHESLVINKSLELISKPEGARITGLTSSGLVLGEGAEQTRIVGFTIDNCKENGILINPGQGRMINIALTNLQLQGKVLYEILLSFARW